MAWGCLTFILSPHVFQLLRVLEGILLVCSRSCEVLRCAASGVQCKRFALLTSLSGPGAQHKATHITIMCKDCRNVKVLPCKPGIGGAMIPRYCDARQVRIDCCKHHASTWGACRGFVLYKPQKICKLAGAHKGL